MRTKSGTARRSRREIKASFFEKRREAMFDAPVKPPALRASETRLLDAALAGTSCALSSASAQEFAELKRRDQTPSDCVVSATFLGDLIGGRRGEIPPFGIELSGAFIAGDLDLRGIQSMPRLVLLHR